MPTPSAEIQECGNSSLPCLPNPVQVLASVTISEPRIPCYSNVTAEPFAGADEVAALLPRQLVEPVQWEGTVRKLVASGEVDRRAAPCRGDAEVTLDQRRLASCHAAT